MNKEYTCEACGQVFIQVDDCQWFCDACFEEDYQQSMSDLEELYNDREDY